LILPNRYENNGDFDLDSLGIEVESVATRHPAKG